MLLGRKPDNQNKISLSLFQFFVLMVCSAIALLHCTIRAHPISGDGTCLFATALRRNQPAIHRRHAAASASRSRRRRAALPRKTMAAGLGLLPAAGNATSNRFIAWLSTIV